VKKCQHLKTIMKSFQKLARQILLSVGKKENPSNVAGKILQMVAGKILKMLARKNSSNVGKENPSNVGGENPSNVGKENPFEVVALVICANW